MMPARVARPMIGIVYPPKSPALAASIKPADETAAAAASAEKNKLGNNSNLSAFQGDELAKAGMSALQRATDTSKIDFN